MLGPRQEWRNSASGDGDGGEEGQFRWGGGKVRDSDSVVWGQYKRV